MGIISSCPFGETSDLNDEIESVIVRSISFGKGGDMTDARSVSFKGRDCDPTIAKALGSGKSIVEGSVSFKRSGEETVISITTPSAGQETDSSSKSIRHKCLDCHSFGSESIKDWNITSQTPILDPGNGKHAAAVKLQKVYKSFRTRRKLADCAVLVEQSWWKLLDFAELKHSSISFFGVEKQESAVSRWSRAKNRAAKVGKGLSKNSKAQKLALQHWLEAIDPRHRYGHNLHFYYDRWLNSQSQEPFFYWLDIGEGKEVNLIEKCPRPKLHQQCIKYLGPMERKAYEVVVVGGKFFYKETGEILDTSGGLMEDKWIFVLSASKTLYVGKKRKGIFQHSSFLAGGATTAAGRLVAENGILKAVWPHSGHYRPTEENFNDFIAFLKENNVDLRDVTTSSEDDEHGSHISSQKSSLSLRYQPSEKDLSHLNQKELTSDSDDVSTEDSTEEKNDEVDEEETESAPEQQKRSRMQNRRLELTDLEIPNRNEISGSFKNILSGDNFSLESPLDGYQTAEETVPFEEKHNVANTGVVHEGNEDDDVELIPKESIVKRIRSRRRLNSYQLGEQLSCKWTSGVGPRISCVRDYPSGLQVHALEQVHLSPRSAGKSFFSPRGSPRVLPSPRNPSKFAPKVPPTP